MPTVKKGSRISYAVSSGFCTLVYHGEVRCTRKHKTLVRFDAGYLAWIDNHYVQVSQ